MNQVQRIVKNIGVMGIAQILMALLSFALIIYLARFLGEADFGKYNFAFSFTSLFVIFADLGVNSLLVREIARKKDFSEQYVNNAILLKLPLSILTFMGIVLTTWLLNFPGTLKILLYLFGIYNILCTISGTCLSLFQAWEKMEYTALFQIIERIIIVTLALTVIFSGYGVIAIGYIYLLAGILDIILAASITFKKFIKPSFKIDLGLQKKLIVMGLPFALNELFAVFFFKIDTILLGFLKGDIAVGIYNAAYNPLLNLSMIIAGIVSAAIYPVMSRYFKENEKALEKFTIISSKYLAILGFPIALGCFVLADKFISIFYAGGYTSSILAFQILALFIPIRLTSTLTGTLLTSINRQGYRTFSVGLSAAFNIIINLILIPYFSYIGASIATVLSELLLYMLFLYYIGYHYKSIKVNQTFTKPAIASLLMALTIYTLKNLNIFILICLAMIIYFICLFLLKTFRDDDKILFNNLLGREA